MEWLSTFYYFSLIWHVRKKLFSGNDLAEITKAYGEKFDMLNLSLSSAPSVISIWHRLTFTRC